MTGTIPTSATGTVLNAVDVALPDGQVDPTPGNNHAEDETPIVPEADLSVTKTDGQTTAVPGTPITYTIVAANAGPFDATGAIVQDTLPAALTGATWICTGSAGGSCAATGVVRSTPRVNLPAGGSVTFLVSATIDAAASGILANTATISPPADVADHDPSNDTATDTTTLTPEADLSITKDDGQTEIVAGSTVVYTIVASNAGPSSANRSHHRRSAPDRCARLDVDVHGDSWFCVRRAVGRRRAGDNGRHRASRVCHVRRHRADRSIGARLDHERGDGRNGDRRHRHRRQQQRRDRHRSAPAPKER